MSSDYNPAIPPLQPLLLVRADQAGCEVPRRALQYALGLEPCPHDSRLRKADFRLNIAADEHTCLRGAEARTLSTLGRSGDNLPL